MLKHYYLNTNTDTNPNNNNEVHAEGCTKMPDISNRVYLGYFANGKVAVKEAKKRGYSRADGCIYCCPEAHQG